jgi:hypothetical protein
MRMSMRMSIRTGASVLFLALWIGPASASSEDDFTRPGP